MWLSFWKWLIFKNHVLSCGGILWGWDWSKWSKVQKLPKSEPLQPILRDWEYVVVVLRSGCGTIGGERLQILYLYNQLWWYLRNRGFKWFLVRWAKSINLDRENMYEGAVLISGNSSVFVYYDICRDRDWYLFWGQGAFCCLVTLFDPSSIFKDQDQGTFSCSLFWWPRR